MGPTVRRSGVATVASVGALLFGATSFGCFDWGSLSASCGQEIPVAFVVAGHTHTCARTTAGALYCWGDNRSGQLGTGDTGPRSSPATVTLPGGANVDRVYVGRGDGQPTSTTAAFTCAQTADGALYCWGSNESGQLGIGNNAPQSSPTKVAGLAPVTTACLGSQHTCALTSSNEVYCWGSNSSGQLGNGGGAATTSRPTLVPTSSFEGTPNSVTCGSDYTCASVTVPSGSNEIYCWGDNSVGQLGARAKGPTNLPSPVNGTSSVLGSSAGTARTCIYGNDQSIVCWGDTSDSQLGTATPAGLWSTGFPGESSMCAIATDQHLSCWGDNTFGQLGTGDDRMRATPAAVASLGAVTSAWVGGQHACAATSAGVRCWGDNTYGQLGTGNVTASTVPMPVLFGCP